ncbi:hypothetical protein C9374_007397 [Naegleria lovaniensis]|uniref:Uncharacterized protein n=1 Tax=Naegleria lovaniensis TaxID=51637 RepID=A0AA88KIU5_NAELO|nr:uncharacterized protein C9374_007397 [Naegleria lovaniensis]KAG2379258.1 hypothetical protein C9374_007397 [Naegleria lovaniensis]
MKKNLQQQEASTVSLKNTFDNKEKELEKLRQDFSSYINFVQTKIGEIQALPREIIRTVNQHDPIEDDTIIFSADEIESSQNVPNHTMINKQPKREIKRPLQFGKSQSKLLLPLNSTKKNLVEPSKSKNDEYKDYENLSDEDFEI